MKFIHIGSLITQLALYMAPWGVNWYDYTTLRGAFNPDK